MLRVDVRSMSCFHAKFRINHLAGTHKGRSLNEGRSTSVPLNAGQRKIETGTFARLAFDPYAAIKLLDNALDDGQPQSLSAFPFRLSDAWKWMEEQRLLFIG